MANVSRGKVIFCLLRDLSIENGVFLTKKMIGHKLKDIESGVRL